ncbi:MAG: O-antigen ligase family protein [Bryobacteraceae bacterium]
MARFNVIPPPGTRVEAAPAQPVVQTQRLVPVAATEPVPSKKAPQPVPTVPESNIAMALICLALFVAVSRISDVIARQLGSSLKVALIVTALASLAAFFTGQILGALRSRGTIAILVLTAWWGCCVPFSVWPGGTVIKFRTEWVFSLAVFFIVATGANTVRGLQRYAGTLALSAVCVNVVLLRYGIEKDLRGAVEFEGSLSNPNFAALHLLIGLPFLVYWVRSSGLFSFRGILGLANAILLAFLIITRTGSRSGLLTLIIMTVLMTMGTKLHTRIALVLGLLVGAAAVIPFVPSYLLYRYGTLLRSTDTETSEAAMSTRVRRELLSQSFEQTLRNPLFGVGPGQFRVAAAANSKDEGERALWLETHNTYTQVSSEMGVPGFLIYIAMIYFSLMPLVKDLRQARRSGVRLPRHEYARAVLISAAGLALNSFFTSMAYQYYWPVLCAMGVAYQRIVASESNRPFLRAPWNNDTTAPRQATA